MTERGFWNICHHPQEQQIPSPDGTGSTLCGKCGAEQHPLSIEDLIAAAQAIKGGPMPELGVDMKSLTDGSERGLTTTLATDLFKVRRVAGRDLQEPAGGPNTAGESA